MRVLLAVLASLLVLPGLGFAAGSSADAGDAEAIVGYGPGGRDDVIDLVHSLGGTVLRENQELRAITIRGNSLAQLLVTLALDPAVEYTETNDLVRAAGSQWNGAQWNGAQWNGAQWNGGQWNGNGTYGDPGAFEQWGLGAVRADRAWNVTTGDRRAALCVIDSGVAYDHPDLAPNLWRAADGTHGLNAIDPRTRARDDAGHGTHMAGIAAAAVRNGIGVAGMGNVSIMSVKVLQADGTGREDDLADGLVWCANNGADVALMALSVDTEGPTVRNAVKYAAERDVLLVASAGNGGCTNCVAYPARDKNVVAVAAVGRDDKPASFNSQGAHVELAAPGVDIVSTFLEDGYASGSGTSQAAAHVAGAAALARDANPAWSADETRERLRASARDVGATGHDARTGHGVLDAGALLEGGRS